MAFRLGISSVQMSDGTHVAVPEHGVVVFVGPNNAGKSVALRELHWFLNRQPPPPGQEPKVVIAAEIHKEGTAEDLQAWIDQHAAKEQRGYELVYRRPGGSEMAWSTLESTWNQDGALNHVVPMVTFFAGADGRLGLASSTASYDVLREIPSTPLQVMVLRPDIEVALSETARDAFGEGLTLNRASGSQLHLHLGTVDIVPSFPPQMEYLEALRRLPMVQEQGDGVRSFVGLMLALTAARYPLIFVDEPEAFLHPPQARLLGRKLATEVPAGTQIFVATHSIDVVQGLLNVPEANVTIVRLVREGDVNPASVLPAEQVRQLWKDPLLRYSNVLDGLFHRGVVLCESDSDARFYSAVLDATREADGLPAHDLLFTHCGGKQRMPIVVDALVAVRVPVAVIADFDVLREHPLLETLVRTLGSSWDAIARDWNIVQSAITNDMGAAPLVSAAREDLENLLNEAGERGARLTPRDVEGIRNATRVDDGWALAKRGGLAALPGGAPSEAAKALLAGLEGIGLFVVDVGELERWAPDIAGHGPAWVVSVLNQGIHASEDLPARTFIKRIDERLERGVTDAEYGIKSHSPRQLPGGQSDPTETASRPRFPPPS